MKAMKSALAACVCAAALLSTMPAQAQSVTVNATPFNDPLDNAFHDVSWQLDVQALGFLNAGYSWVYGEVSGYIDWGDGSANTTIFEETFTSPLDVHVTYNHSYGTDLGSFDSRLHVGYYAASRIWDCDGGTCGWNYIVQQNLVHSAGLEYFHAFEPTSPVPEPETYAMLLAGLGLLGFAARRRKLKETASA